MKYHLEVRRRARWVTLPTAHDTLNAASFAMSAVADRLRTGACLRVRRTGRGEPVVGPTFTVIREPGLRRRSDDHGWRAP